MSGDRIKLVAFDMEGCLTADPTVWEIMHRKLGTWESHGRPYWERFRAGEFPYDRFARMDAAVWRGAPLSLLREAARTVAYTSGCSELLQALAASGVQMAVISNGLQCVASRLQRDFGVQYIYANRIAACNGVLTGQVEISVPYEGKGRILRQLAERLGLSRDRIAAVGDSPSDIAMFREAARSVAIRPSEAAVSAEATCCVTAPDLRPLLDILLNP